MKKIENKIINALKKTFTKSKVPKKIDKRKIGEFKGWDSLGHVNLLLEIEKVFKVKFDSKIFLNLDSVNKIKKELIKLL